MVRYLVLGPVRALDGSRELPIGHARQRCLLAMLLLEMNTTVPVDRLIELLWDGLPPRSARNVIAGYATRLRRALVQGGSGTDGTALLSRDGGYVLQADPEALDLNRFRRLREEAERAGDDATAADLLRRALTLWTGPALGDLAGRGPDAVRAALERERAAAWLACCDAEFALGRHGRVLADLSALADERPLDEEVAQRLITALAETGNPAAAVERFEATRRTLAAELGVTPCPRLATVAARIRTAVRPEPSSAVCDAAEPFRLLSLPTRPATVVGREQELEVLRALTAEGAADSANLLIVDGMSGVGKTTLVLHWAHRAQERFPDGRFFVSLRGHDPYLSPVTSAEALTRCLQALGVPAEEVPFGLEQRAAVFRTLLADRKVLIILDDATSDEQVEHLIPPGRTGSAVVVTCRHHPVRLAARFGARRLGLDVLPPPAAVEFLRSQTAPRLIPRPAALRLARACGFLPLALSVVVADLHDRPDAEVDRIAADLLAPARTGGAGDRPRDRAAEPWATVRRAFDQSYGALPGSIRRVFRHLGLVPGPHFGTAAVAALLGADPAQTDEDLAALLRSGLLNEVGSRRYALHDLVRAYAADVVAEQESGADRSQALDRLLTWYRSMVEQMSTAAGIQLSPSQRGTVPAAAGPGLDGSRQALAWLDVERANLCAAIRSAHAHGLHAASWRLADALCGYMRLYTSGPEWDAAIGSAVAAVTRDGDWRGRSALLQARAEVEYRNGRHEATLHCAGSALSVARKAGWRAGEAMSLAALGRARWSVGDLLPARRALRAAHTLACELDDHHVRTMVEGRLGCLEHDLGDLAVAHSYYLSALASTEKSGSRLGKALIPGYLARLTAEQGRHLEARDWCDRAESASRALQFPDGVALALACRAAVWAGLGDVEQTRQAVSAGHGAVTRVEDPRIAVDCLNLLGAAEAVAGPGNALITCRLAQQWARRVGYQQGMVAAGLGLAAVECREGRYGPAALGCAQTRQMIGSRPMRLAVAMLHLVEAEIALGRGQPSTARNEYLYAAQAYENAGHRLGRVRALLGCGRASWALGQREAAAGEWLTALGIADPIGVPESELLRRLLDPAVPDPVAAP